MYTSCRISTDVTTPLRMPPDSILFSSQMMSSIAFWGKCALRIAEFGLHLSANNGHLSGSWAFTRIKLVYLCAYYHTM